MLPWVAAPSSEPVKNPSMLYLLLLSVDRTGDSLEIVELARHATILSNVNNNNVLVYNNIYELIIL